MTLLHLERTAAVGTPRGTIVALPGLAESAASLAVTARHWAQRGFHVLALDPRGHGRSPRWTGALLARHPGDVIVEEVLATLAEALDDDQPIVLFGHSAGGSAAAAVAAALAAADPGRVGAVVLEDPFWRLPVTPRQDRAVAENAAADLLRLQSLTDREREDEASAAHPGWPADELAGWSASKAQADIALVGNGDVIPTTAWPTLLGDLRDAGVAVLIVTGTVLIGNTADHRAIQRLLGAEVVVVQGASHFIRRDARDRFHALVDAFLDKTLEGR